MTQSDSSRTEFGFEATQCACVECTRNCQFIPGYVVPDDLQRMRAVVDPDLKTSQEFAEKYLLASSGATVMVERQIVRIPTLVPARKEDGSCVFLTADQKCGIHSVAPFGCRFFDAHMSDVTANKRSAAGLRAILEDNAVRGEYKRTWDHLNQLGRIAPSARESRQAMLEDFKRDHKPVLPFAPESPEQLRARLAKAFQPLVRAVLDGSGQLPYRPGAHRRHVFEYVDGMRFILSRDDLDPTRQTDGEVLHLSASFEHHRDIYHKLATMIRKTRDQDLVRQAFEKMVLLRFAELSGYTVTAQVVWSEMDVPHWFVPWQAFADATGIQPEE